MFKILDPICAPTKGSKYSAGIDLYARETIVIGAGETAKIPLGVCIEQDWLPEFWVGSDNIDEAFHEFKSMRYLELHPRSSLRAKGLVAGVGIIDLDFAQEVQMIVHNPIKRVTVTAFYNNEDYLDVVTDAKITPMMSYTINKGDKIAQVLLKEHKGYLLGIDSDEERAGGFGSSGGYKND